MKSELLSKAVPPVTAGAAAVVLAVWLLQAPRPTVDKRLPGADAVPESLRAATGPARVDLGPPTTLPAEALQGRRLSGAAAPAELPGGWNAFRGPNRDGISPEATPLARTWPAGGPPVLWQVDLGQGHAGPAVHAGRVYLLDYDEENLRDTLRCMSLADGEEIWRYSYPVHLAYDHGMSRTVPAVRDGYVVTLGPMGHVLCLDAAAGTYRWGMDLARQLGAEIPRWYAGQCPLIDAGRAILAPGAAGALMIAVDCQSGKVLWTTPNPMGWKMTHSSIAVMSFGGRKMYVYCGSGGVAGVSAENGKILWRTKEWKIRIATVPTPVPLPDGKILFTGGYNAGAMMLQLEDTSGELVPKVVLRLKAKVFGAEQHTPVFYDGHVYGVRPNGELVCLDLTGGVKWASGKGDRFGKGKSPFLLADGLIYVMDESGTLTLATATPAGYQRLARARVIEKGKHSWAPMAMAGGLLLVRDLTRMVCLDVRAKR